MTILYSIRECVLTYVYHLLYTMYRIVFMHLYIFYILKCYKSLNCMFFIFLYIFNSIKFILENEPYLLLVSRSRGLLCLSSGTSSVSLPQQKVQYNYSILLLHGLPIEQSTFLLIFETTVCVYTYTHTHTSANTILQFDESKCSILDDKTNGAGSTPCLTSLPHS